MMAYKAIYAYRKSVCKSRFYPSPPLKKKRKEKREREVTASVKIQIDMQWKKKLHNDFVYSV